MIVRQPNESLRSYYDRLNAQLDRYEREGGRYAGIQATAVRREMRRVWNEMESAERAS